MLLIDRVELKDIFKVLVVYPQLCTRLLIDRVELKAIGVVIAGGVAEELLIDRVELKVYAPDGREITREAYALNRPGGVERQENENSKDVFRSALNRPGGVESIILSFSRVVTL